MSLLGLGLQAAAASGAEPSFDGQPMTRGMHLRWSFAPEWGFPPGAFWLLRRITSADTTKIDPPPAAVRAAGSEKGRSATGDLPPGAGWAVGTVPGWDAPDDLGWRAWNQPFTLPVTVASWPPSYAGARDPAISPAAVLRAADLAECARRLGPLHLVATMPAAKQQAHFDELRTECIRLVQGWPCVPNYDVALQASTDGASAPALALNVVQYLQVAALNPYLARVLGLYFVDETAEPGELYDYCIVGFWGREAPRVLLPGGAPRGGLSHGSATYGGMSVSAADARLYAWVNPASAAGPVGSDASGADLSATPGVRAAFTAALAGLAAQPGAMLAAQMRPSRFPLLPLPVSPVVCEIALQRGAAQVDVQVAGAGTVTALAGGTAVGSQAFSGAALQSLTFLAADPFNQPIDQLTMSSAGGSGSVVVVGELTAHTVAADYVGVRWALLHAPRPMTAPGPPAAPATTFRKRQANVTPGPVIAASSLFDTRWLSPAITAADQTGNPVTDPAALPRPLRAIGYVAELADGDLSAPQRLSRIVAAAPQPDLSDTSASPPGYLRVSASGLADPDLGYAFRAAAFGVFGQLGRWGPWSRQVGVEKIAGAPTRLRLVSFDNSAPAGGHPDDPANPGAWVGGTLTVEVSWSGSALLMYPDARTARLTVTADDDVTVLATADFDVPAPVVTQYILRPLVTDTALGVVYVTTSPPLPELQPADADASVTPPAAALTLTGLLANGTVVTERFAVRPGRLGGAVVATLPAGPAARIVANQAAFHGQPAYLVQGVTVPLTVDVPLPVPVTAVTARAKATVTASTSAPFDPGEQITDPNGINPPRAEPESAPVIFTGPQRLPPATPAPPEHPVDHQYYAPADATGGASKVLSFSTSAGPDTAGFLLMRAPAHSLYLADIKRRRAGAGLADNQPVLQPPRPDLQLWISALPAWLTAYNARGAAAAAAATPPAPWTNLTQTDALDSADAQRSFIEHFYYGLLDDELRALADIVANGVAFASTSTARIAVDAAVYDTVSGTGFGRNLYQLAAVNQAGSVSARSGSMGPIYTVAVTPSRRPVLYQVTVQRQTASLIVAWTLDDSPDVAGYLVYRATDPAQLTDLRFFGGTDPEHPADPATLARPVFTPGTAPGLTLTAGSIDPRLVGLVNDPRCFARDYPESDMGEIALAGPAPAASEIAGVYRLNEYQPGAGASQPQAFNYWTPFPDQGIAALVTDSPARWRLTGLRLGTGRAVAAVVLTATGAALRAYGSVPVRRVAFVDGPASASGGPADPNAVAGWTAPDLTQVNYCAVAVVDTAGNISQPSAPFGVPALAPA
jgi:hypothetical protein